MNKKLLAMAVGAALVAGATAATAGDEPTFYGKIHMSIDSMDNDTKDDPATPAVDESSDGIYVSSNSSRFGFKGAVDLDGGMKAVYKYEISTDYTGGLSGNRNAYLGLKGGFGQVIAGRHDMPFKTVGRKADLFGDTIGDTRALTRVSGDGDDWADRRNNVVMYTNKFGAVDLKIALGQEENTDKGGDVGIGLGFKQGPLKVMFANETHGKGNLSGATAPATEKDSTGNFLTGAYTMGNMTGLAGYLAIDNVGGDEDVSVSGFTLGGKMKSGMNTFKLQYTSVEADVDGAVGAKLASTLLAVGVDHKLGKKTTAYAMYAAIDNDRDIDFGFSGTGHASTVAASGAGTSPSGFPLGLVHKF